MRGLACSSGSRKGQNQVTILRLHMPWASLQAVRAPAAVAAQGGLSDTSPKDETVGDLCLAVPGSHRGSPGEPAGALQARTTVPAHYGRADAEPRVGKRVNERGVHVTSTPSLTRHVFVNLNPLPALILLNRIRICDASGMTLRAHPAGPPATQAGY